jgi:hypoxanthine phosphoribosyltransferase
VTNKVKPKSATLPANVKYFSGTDYPDAWIDFPWEQQDIDEHDRLVAAQAGNNTAR